MSDDITPEGSDLEPMAPEPQPQWPADPGPTTENAVPPAPFVAPASGGAVPPGAVPSGTPPSGEEPAKGPSWKTWVAVAGTAAVVGAAAVFGISAATSSDSSNPAVSTQADGNATGQVPGGGAGYGQNGQGRGFAGRGGFGTISEISGSSFSIKGQNDETTKVKTSSDTKVTISSTGSIDDIKVGDTVSVVGSGSGTEISATTVNDEGRVSSDDAAGGPGGAFRNGTPPEGMTPPDGANGNGPPAGMTPPEGMTPPDGSTGNGGPPNGGQFPGGADGSTMTRGVVKSVGDGTFTVTGINDTVVTVTVGSDAKVTIAKEASVSDLKVGDTVMVIGETSDATITATRIREGATLGGGFFNGSRNGPPGAPNQGGSGSSTSSDGSQ